MFELCITLSLLSQKLQLKSTFLRVAVNPQVTILIYFLNRHLVFEGILYIVTYVKLKCCGCDLKYQPIKLVIFLDFSLICYCISQVGRCGLVCRTSQRRVDGSISLHKRWSLTRTLLSASQIPQSVRTVSLFGGITTDNDMMPIVQKNISLFVKKKHRKYYNTN